MNSESSPEERELLRLFNARDRDALGEVYQKYYRELHTFARRLFHDTDTDPSDLIHDIFLSVFRSHLRFDSLDGIKAYVYVAVRNRFKDYLAHSSHVTDYRRAYRYNNDAFETDIVEVEFYSTMQYAMHLLPEDCANVFRLFMEGWNAEEIAEMTRQSIHTVYNKKQKAVRILKEKLSPDKLLLLNIL